jgi:hypothetical protein
MSNSTFDFSVLTVDRTYTFPDASITLGSAVGSTAIVTVGTVTAGTWHGTKIGLLYGGTNADLSATGGASQVLQQASSGAAVTVGQLAVADLSTAKTGTGSIVLATAPTFASTITVTTNAIVTGKVLTTAGLGVGNSAAATTLGTVTKKIEVFDAAGVSLGFVPVYDSIS